MASVVEACPGATVEALEGRRLLSARNLDPSFGSGGLATIRRYADRG
jgi:hypothetical protein